MEDSGLDDGGGIDWELGDGVGDSSGERGGTTEQ